MKNKLIGLYTSGLFVGISLESFLSDALLLLGVLIVALAEQINIVIILLGRSGSLWSWGSSFSSRRRSSSSWLATLEFGQTGLELADQILELLVLGLDQVESVQKRAHLDGLVRILAQAVLDLLANLVELASQRLAAWSRSSLTE